MDETKKERLTTMPHYRTKDNNSSTIVYEDDAVSAGTFTTGALGACQFTAEPAGEDYTLDKENAEFIFSAHIWHENDPVAGKHWHVNIDGILTHHDTPNGAKQQISYRDMIS